MTTTKHERSARAPEMQRKQHNSEQPHDDGMVMLAKQVTQHYSMPTPDATPPRIEPFPPAVMRGLGSGAIIGAVLGALLAAL